MCYAMKILVYVKGCVGLPFLGCCSPIQERRDKQGITGQYRGFQFAASDQACRVWEELRFHQHRGSGKIVPNRMRVCYVRCFRIDEAYFRLGFGCMWRFLSGGALPQAEINERAKVAFDGTLPLLGLADVPWSHLLHLRRGLPDAGAKA